MKQIKLKRNMIDNYQNEIQRPKTPTRDSKTCFIQENNKTPKIIIKKTINIILNKPETQKIHKEEEINKEENNEEINKEENNEENKEENYEENEKEELEINDDIKEQVKQLDIFENKNEKNPEMHLDIDKNNLSIEDKVIEIKNDKEFSIESFTKYRKSKAKHIIKNEEEVEDNNNEQDITLTEKYQDCENFVYFLRTQLIYCFLANKNYDDSFLD